MRLPSINTALTVWKAGNGAASLTLWRWLPKLTESSIKAAKCPPDKDRLELSDAACPGLILRVTKAGSKTFSFKYWSPLGKTVALTLGSYPDLALAAARSKVADHRKT